MHLITKDTEGHTKSIDFDRDIEHWQVIPIDSQQNDEILVNATFFSREMQWYC